MKYIKALVEFIVRWFLHLFEGRSVKSKRKRYRFAVVDSLPKMNVQNGSPLPFDENPSIDWLLTVAEAAISIVVNHLENRADNVSTENVSTDNVSTKNVSGEQASSGDVQREVDKLKKLTSVKKPNGLKISHQLKMVVEQVEDEKIREQITSHWQTSLAGYNDFFNAKGVPLPEVSKNFQPRAGNEGWFEDSFFADLRTAGFNPMVIRGVSEIPAWFTPMSQAQYTAAVGAGFGTDTMAEAAADGRLYHCDYSMLESLIDNSKTNSGGCFPNNDQKYVYLAQALFVLPPTATNESPASLVPVAIRLTENGPIFYPNDPDDTHAGKAWTQAKYAVNSADGNHHELFSHLGWTHLVIEPFAICTQRNLSESHPLYKLLVPHFEGTIFINNAAAAKLIANEGQVDQILAGAAPNDQKLAVAARAINNGGYFKFNAQFVEKELENRNVLDKRLLFPYRDDARRVSAAITTWVTSYVCQFYSDDKAVQGDIELQNWASEIVSTDVQGGQIQDFGDAANPDFVISTRSYLIDALSMIIFTGSAQHAAVNFAQSVIMLYVPAFPGGLYSPAPDSIPSTVETYSADGKQPGLLTPDGVTKVQVDLLALLGGVYYTQLGQYGDDYFTNEKVSAALLEFQRNLDAIGIEINEANKTRRLKYPYLVPTKIPQSVNV